MEGTSDGFSSLPAWAAFKLGFFVGHTGSLGATGPPPHRHLGGALLVYLRSEPPIQNGLKMQV